MSSVSPPNSSQRVMRRCRGLTSLAHESRTFVIILLSVYTLYIQIVSSMSKNWDSTRVNGFSQPQFCTSALSSYDSGEYYIDSTQEYSKPLIYKDDNPYSVCFSQSFFLNCVDALKATDTGASIEEFSSYFNRSDKVYFPFATITVVLAFVSLLLTALYESKDEHFLRNDEGALFGSRNCDRKIFIRINYLICTTLVVVSITAASFVMFLGDERCEAVYKKQLQDPNYCTTVNSCGMTISSIVSPSDFFARNYRSINIVFAILLILSILSRCMSQGSNADRILPTLADGNDGLDQRVRLELDLSVARRAYLISAQNQPPRIPNWKEFSTAEETTITEVECPICLNHLSKGCYAVGKSRRMGSSGNSGSSGSAGANYAAVESNEVMSFDNNNNINNNELEDQQLYSARSALESSGKDKKIVQAKCTHVFHEVCIQQWFRNHDTCPVCRHTLF
jgi:hypothetical protein